MEYNDFLEWLEYQSSGNWFYVERESDDRCRFDWGRDYSFWVNDDWTIEGYVPELVKTEIKGLDILITYI